MKDFKFIHTYKHYKGQKRPVITTALKLDKSGEELLGVGVGLSYCSSTDHPNKKIGRMIAVGRAKNAILHHHKLVENAPIVAKVMTGAGSNYVNERRIHNENGEPVNRGHTHYFYVPFPAKDVDFSVLNIPEEQHVYSRLMLALVNIQKFGQL